MDYSKIADEILDIDKQVEALRPKVTERTSTEYIIIALITLIIISGYVAKYLVLGIALFAIAIALFYHVTYLHIKLYRLMRRAIKLSRQLPDEE